MTELFKTALYETHLKLGARMVPFAGYSMPVQYKGVIEETKACRQAGGLFDVSHMGQFRFTGDRVFEKIQVFLSNDLKRIPVGKAQYSFFCNSEGGVIDDVVVYKLQEEEAFLCVNASNRHINRNWIEQNLPQGVQFEDLSDNYSLIAVQGPQAETLLQSVLPSLQCDRIPYYGVHKEKTDNLPFIVSRTGYTGEDGFEIYLSNQEAPGLWKKLLEKGQLLGVVPCGLGARDTLRLEMGYPLHGHELSTDITPLEAGLGWAVKLDEPYSFIGKEALLNQKAKGLDRRLVAFLIEDKRLARAGYPIAVKKGEPIGVITSGTFSPHLAAPIALGLVSTPFIDSNEFYISIRNDWVPAKKMKLPFIQSRVKK